jgi:multiple sugar transport system permease protein
MSVAIETEYVPKDSYDAGGFSSPFEKKSKWTKLRRIPLYLVSIVMIAPYYWMITSSVKSVQELQKVPPTVVPEKWTWVNYFNGNFGKVNNMSTDPSNQRGLFQRFEEVQFGFFHYVLNSLFIVITITIATMLISSLAAYVVSKHRLKGKRTIYLVIIGSMMVPWQVGIIPNFLTMSSLNWLDTYWAYIIPALPKAFIVFFLVQYLASIPDELVESARIDRASEFTIWWRIILPLLKPAMIAMMIFAAIGEWNNFLWPMIIASSEEMWNLPVALSMLRNNGAGNIGMQGIIMGASLLASIPTVLLFLFTQKHFIRGIALSGIK